MSRALLETINPGPTMPPIVSFIGRPDSGKTTLLAQLIPALTRRGIRVGVIKHHMHCFAMDTPGKDTWRLKQAGAAAVALSAPTGLGIIRDTTQDTPVAEVVAMAMADMDLVLTEGYKQEGMPKIEVHRGAVHAAPLADPDQTWVAYVSDATLSTPLPVFSFEQVEELADFIITRFLTNPEPGVTR